MVDQTGQTGPPPVNASLVGRERERTMLRAAIDAAFAGRGSLVLIGGEAGIGKTALAEATLAEATGRGALALVGRCYDRTATPPYGPWRELARAAPPDAALPPWPGALATDGAGTPAAGPDALFEQVRDGLAARAARRPLVLLLDDLHWADPASLDLLRALARQLGDLPFLLLATHRTDEVTRRHPLYQLIPLLLREAPAALLDLAPLAEEDTRALVATRYWLASRDTARLVDHLHAHARGNPFYARELLRHLEEREVLRLGTAGWQLSDLAEVRLPPLLRQVIDGRVARLGDQAQRLLAVAAVIGHAVPLALWSAVGDILEEDLLDLIERAAEAHLLVAVGAGSSVAFAHALVREALYEGVLPPRRRAWHRRVAETLADLPNPDPDAVAQHFGQAGDPRAEAWLVQAGARAQRAYAWLTAAERYEAALALLEARGGDAAARGWLTFWLASLRRNAEPQRALGDAEAAERLAAEARDPLLAAMATFLAGLLRGIYLGEPRRGIAQMAAGLAAQTALPAAARIPPGMTTPIDPAPQWGTVAATLGGNGRYAEALALGERYLADAAPPATADWLGGNPYADAHSGLGEVHRALGRPEDARAAFARAGELYRAVGLHRAAWLAADDELYVVLSYQLDRPAELRRLQAEAAGAQARARGVHGPALQQYVPPPWLLVLAGAWTEARRASEAMRGHGPAGSSPHLIGNAALGVLDREQGDAARARALVAEDLPAGPETALGTCYALPALQLQRLAATLALDAADPGLARVWLEAHDRWLQEGGIVLGRAEGALGWAAYHRAKDDRARAQQDAEHALLQATAPRQPLALLAAHRLLGELATLAGRHTEAASHLAAALALADECATPYERALTLLALATLRAEAGPRGDVAPLLAEVRAICTPIAAARALAHAAALTATLVTARSPDGLTPREVEVLRLYAADLSYRAIGARLSIAPRTVGTHVSNIYGKTGVTSRLAAARYAAAHGLA